MPLLNYDNTDFTRLRDWLKENAVNPRWVKEDLIKKEEDVNGKDTSL